MIPLFNYFEFGVPDSDSIKNYFSEVSYKHKETIITYMKQRGTEKCICGLATDVINGKIIGTRKLLHDDKYSWTSDLIYYIEKYNLKLPDDFIQHVLNNS